eukprot:12088535-Karenia_brevis.AAC.1
MMTKHRGRSRAQSEGSNDRNAEEDQPKEELYRQVSLKRDLATELDAVAEEDRKGTTAATTVVPSLLKEFASP